MTFPKRHFDLLSCPAYSNNDLEHCVTCCARLWDNFHHVSP